MKTEELQQILKNALADRETFTQLILSDMPASGSHPACRKVSVRPPDSNTTDSFQVHYFTDKKHLTKHQPLADVIALLALPFTRAHLQCAQSDLHVRITKKGKILISRGKPSQAQATERSAAHDRSPAHLLPAHPPHPLLQALGIQTRAGQIKSSRKDKFHQINQFLDIIAGLESVRTAKGPFHVIDCGCGAAYLTFAAHQYLSRIDGLDPHTVGIDTNTELIGKCEALCDKLRYPQLTFEAHTIGEYRPTVRPRLVLSLHACDTATDEALALGVRAKAHVILAAPCCQHELREQLANASMHAMLRHGVLRSRQADLVTDAARAALLRIAGYTCDVIEFVSPEHSGKNLMLRAERRSSKPLPGAEEDYAAFRAAWQITPTLERLLNNPSK